MIMGHPFADGIDKGIVIARKRVESHLKFERDMLARVPTERRRIRIELLEELRDTFGNVTTMAEENAS